MCFATTAMALLQGGVDTSSIALWLGHESPATTHVYLDANLALKVKILIPDGSVILPNPVRKQVLFFPQASTVSSNDERRMSTISKLMQSPQIQLVIMIVADEHGVNVGQIIHRHPRFPSALWT
jgi:hypothetical protein